MQALHRAFSLISPIFRRRRRHWLERKLTVAALPNLLDIGGYPWCWPAEDAARVTLLNIDATSEHKMQFPLFHYVTADACALPFADGSFALAHSNSVIEHVGTWERQQAFAAEARRVGARVWVQTPAREFFIEPHLLTPFIHWLPRRTQRGLLRWGTLWGWLTRPSPPQVEGFLNEVRLLTREEMEYLFPDCEILTERFFGLAKSYIAVRRA